MFATIDMNSNADFKFSYFYQINIKKEKFTLYMFLKIINIFVFLVYNLLKLALKHSFEILITKELSLTFEINIKR